MNLFDLIDKIKESKLFKKVQGHKHRYVIRYDDREDFDEGRHTCRVTYCEECGKVKSIEQIA
jgi:hypothetical protein